MSRLIDIYVVSYDGVMSWTCGVGTGTYNAIGSLPHAARILADEGLRCRVRIVTPLYNDGFPGYDAALLRRTIEVTSELDGTVVLHVDGSDGTTQFGDVDRWRASSLGAASAVLARVDRRAAVSVVLATDTPYAGVGAHLATQLRGAQVPLVTVWTPHSTGRNHGLADEGGARDDWERAAVAATTVPRSRLGAINEFMRRHLIDEFGADAAGIVALTNGLPLHEPVPPRAPTVAVTARVGIEPGRRYVFACGRAERYKGFLDLIRAFHASQQDHDLDLLLVLSELTRQDPVFDECAALIRHLRVRARLIGAFLSQDELRALVRLPAIAVFAVPSLAEPFGILPLEVRWWCEEHAPVVVVSDRDGLRDLVREGIDGFRAEITDQRAFAGAITRAAHVDGVTRRQLLAIGKAELFSRYDFGTNIARCVREVVADWDRGQQSC